MAQGTLAGVDDIQLVDDQFKNQNWAEAAEEILEFWEQGVKTFVEMEELGEWSRSHYQNVFHKHFQALGDETTTIDAEVEDMPSDAGYRRGYKDGFNDGLAWARDNPELFNSSTESA